MLPREHGAYFQLGIPLVAAWCAYAPTPAGVALGLAACLAFLAHEPLAIVLGGRGQRATATDGARARTRLAIIVPAAIATGLGGLALAPPHTLAIAGAVVACAAVVVVLASRRREHSLIGELVAAIALTGASAVVVAAGGGSLDVALRWWLGWAIGFGLTVIAVQHVIARHKHPATGVDHTLAVGFVVATLVLIAQPIAAISVPLAAIATVIVIAPPRASRLTVVGITIAMVATGSAVLAIATS